MPQDAVNELCRIVLQLKDWLAFQGRLGWLGVPWEPTRQPRPLQPTRPTLAEVRAELGDCQRCKLARTRTNLVFGTGSSQARLMFVGEGPGEEEDLRGLPFVGAAGQLLNRMLGKLGLGRDEVYITNVVKCRPPGNREPQVDEIAHCLPFLDKQVASLRPRVIVTLGKVATHALLATQTPITKLRGRWQRYGDIPVMPTFHPSYLLRNPRERFKTWDDMQQVMELLAAHEED